MRRSRLFVLLVLALVLLPARALAWDVIPKGVLYQAVLDGSRTGYVVSAYNQFDAAAYAIGKDPNTIPADVKAKLSDSDYGGRFYDYAQSFFTQSGGLDNVPTWVPTYVIMVSELADLVYADYQAVWYSTATYSLYEDAMVDFVRVLNGEDLGGGSGGGSGGGTVVPVGDYYSFSLSSFRDNFSAANVRNNYFSAQNATYEDGNLVLGSGTTNVSAYVNNPYFSDSSILYVNNVLLRTADEYLNSGSDVMFWFNGSQCGLIFGHFSVLYGKPVSSYASDSYYVRFSGSNNGLIRFSCTPYYNSSDGTFAFVPDFSNPSVETISNGAYSRVSYFSSIYTEPFSTPPDGDWPAPDSPASPVEPDLPDPTTPTVEPEPVIVAPTVTWPDIDITVNPPSVVVPTTPDGQDYTQLLTLINDNLNSINAYTVAINSGLGSIDSDLLVGFDSVVTSIRNVYTYLQHLDDILERHCVHIRNQIEDSASFLANYVRQLVHWLAEQLDYDSDVTGSNDLFGILSTISNKLGGGTYEPNPISDEQGYYEWLDDLWDRFLLGDDWENSASSMSQDFGQLTTRFPFSVPWDIVALFRLFVHDPVTPVFDLPLYYSAEGSTPVHVDLSPWDGVAAVVRPLLFVIFALKLALLSRNLLGGFGSESGV